MKRRLTPPNLAKPVDHVVRNAELGATPIAASAFWTLWRPGIGSSMPRDRADLASAVAERRRSGCRPGRRHIVAAHVGLGGEAIGHDPPVAQARDDRLDLGMVDAEQGRAVERHILDEFDEGVLHLVERAIMVEMLGIDVGDDRDRPVEPEEAAVALVGLDHHPVRAPSRAFEP